MHTQAAHGRCPPLRTQRATQNWLVSRTVQCRRRRVAAKGGLLKIFSGGEEKKVALIDVETADFGPEPDSIVLSEATGDAGTAKVVYTPGGHVDVDQLAILCEKVGWPKRPADKVAVAIQNSYLVCTLHLITEAAGNQECSTRLIGLGRATSDHVFNATVWDVLVDPEFQGQGLGKALVEQMVRHMLRNGISNITLFADSGVVSFYEKLGFAADPEGIKGMFWYPRR